MIFQLLYYQFMGRYLKGLSLNPVFEFLEEGNLRQINMISNHLTLEYPLLSIVCSICKNFDHNPFLEVHENFLNISKTLYRVWQSVESLAKLFADDISLFSTISDTSLSASLLSNDPTGI